MTTTISIRGTNPDKTPAQIAEETTRAYELRLQGYSLRAIAETMTAEGFTGISKDTVDRRVKAEIKERIEPLANEYIAMELDKLDRYETKLQVKIDLGDDKAINAALRIAERRAKLLGLDQPERLDMRVSAVDPQLNAALTTFADDEPDDPYVIDGEVIDE